MSKLTLSDLGACLRHVLVTRRSEIDAVAPAKAYTPLMDPTLAKLEALPAAAVGGKANAELLESADALHDGVGEALYYLALAYLSHPKTRPEVKAAARFIKENIVTSRRELGAAFATEATRAHERRPRIEAGRATLDLLPVDGGTAFGWAIELLDAADELDVLLVGRADAKVDRSPAGGLRGKAIAQIGRLRELVAEANEADPAPARRLDDRFFGYYDLLEAMRARGDKEPTPPPPADPPPAG